jgi:predicted CoA-binding protein
MKKRVVILGASADRSKFGNKAVRAYLQKGWDVVPVNPKGGQIEGLPAATSLHDVAGPVDLVSVYLPPAIGIALLEDIAALNPAEVMFNPGAESPEILERAAQLGLNAFVACSIIAVGATPAAFGD